MRFPTRILLIGLIVCPVVAYAAELDVSNKAKAPFTRIEGRDVAVVDLQRVYEHFVRLENLPQRMSDKGRQAGAEVGKKTKRLAQLQEQERQYRVSAGLRPDVADQAKLDSLAEEIRFVQDEVAVLLRDKAQELTDRERQWSVELLSAISDQVRRLAASDKLYLVLDRGAWMLSVWPRADLTDRLIRNLERERGNLRFQ